MTDAQLDILFARRIENHARYAADNYQGLLKLAGEHGTPLASHDDTTSEHVRQSIGVAVAKFPTTVEAAAALHGGGVKVLMGAPNLVRGGVWSGGRRVA